MNYLMCHMPRLMRQSNHVFSMYQSWVAGEQNVISIGKSIFNSREKMSELLGSLANWLHPTKSYVQDLIDRGFVQHTGVSKKQSWTVEIRQRLKACFAIIPWLLMRL